MIRASRCAVGDPLGEEEGGKRWENGTVCGRPNRVERAVLLSADHTGIEVEDTVVEILEDSQGRRRLRGRGRVRNASWGVELLDGARNWTWCSIWGESSSTGFRHPDIQGGKVFTPGQILYPVSAAAAVGTAVGAGFHCFNVPGPILSDERS